MSKLRSFLLHGKKEDESRWTLNLACKERGDKQIDGFPLKGREEFKTFRSGFIEILHTQFFYCEVA